MVSRAACSRSGGVPALAVLRELEGQPVRPAASRGSKSRCAFMQGIEIEFNNRVSSRVAAEYCKSRF